MLYHWLSPHCFPVSLISLCIALSFPACAPRLQYAEKNGVTAPALTDDAILMDDGVQLPLQSWLPKNGSAQAVILALHGFNDYANAFAHPGTAWAELGIATYAYDQRGFGRTAQPGIWPGQALLVGDLQNAVAALRHRHPDIPLYIVGESMGGAVVMAATDDGTSLDIDGLILVAPAIWGHEFLGPLGSGLLWASAHTMPWWIVTGAGLDIQPSDNIPMLIALGKDPWVQKETRIDAVYGLVNLMERAYQARRTLPSPTFILYGAHEEVIPGEVAMAFLNALPSPRVGEDITVAIYPEGYHLLLRDLGRALPQQDIAAWILGKGGSLPSGYDQLAKSAISARLPHIQHAAAPAAMTARSKIPPAANSSNGS